MQKEAGLHLTRSQNTAPEKRTHLRTTLLDKLVHGSFRTEALKFQLLNPLQSRLIHPTIYYCKPMRSYWARIEKGRLSLSCENNRDVVLLNLEGLPAGKRGCAAQVKAIALATKRGSTMMSVEYVTPANDGKGRLYARQIGAQSLPRQLRLLIYGDTQKEVDISGAHYHTCTL